MGAPVTEESDEIDRLVAAVVEGDRRALNQLLMILRPLVVRYCRSRLGAERGGVAADDVAQEVCLAVLKSLPTYTDQGKPFLAFVYGIAAHKVVDAHRHAGRDRSEPTDDVPEGFTDAVGPEQAALEMSASAEMRELLAQLPAKQREILVLRVVVGLSAEETALAVGSTPGAVRVAQHRAVAKLRGVMTGADDDRGPDDTPPRGLLSTRAGAGTRTGRRGRA
ncbi:RNA polymerase sigma-70 factor (ECF subfamily) [Actinomycetospora succinea]|uniref:RNA polymerase sigma-70 factor (ECF subfamily) n=1 Tax=Actinomycetospora succinea TaxID=663603 RepID=A0A4R6UWF2_9PSEU|nr:RNA polymerase sigma-70 factor (ECF subfamily) [Actinomycetospora succinea]